MNIGEFLLGAALVFAAAACGDGGVEGSGGATSTSGVTTGQATTGMTTVGTSGTGTTSTSATGGATPTVTLSLSTNTMSPGATVTGTVSVTDFVLEAPKGQGNQPGHGHYHVFLDGATGGNYLVADQVPSVAITIPVGTSQGPHTLRVSLGQNNHAPVSPAVEDVVDITVQ